MAVTRLGPGGYPIPASGADASISLSAVSATTEVAALNAKFELSLTGVEASTAVASVTFSSEQQSISLAGVYATSSVANFGNRVEVLASTKGHGRKPKSSGTLSIDMDDPYTVPVGTAGTFGVAISQLTAVSVTPTAAVGGAGAFAFDIQVDENGTLAEAVGTAAVADFTPEVAQSLTGVEATSAADSFSLQISPSLNLTATEATGSAGTFAPNISDNTGITATLPIVAATGAAAILGVSYDVPIADRAATAEAGDWSVGFDVSVSEATASGVAGDIAANYDATLDLTAAVALGDALAFDGVGIAPSLEAAAAASALGDLFSEIEIAATLQGVVGTASVVDVEVAPGLTPVEASGLALPFGLEVIEVGYLICASIGIAPVVSGLPDISAKIIGLPESAIKVSGLPAMAVVVSSTPDIGLVVSGEAGSAPKVSGLPNLETC